MPRRSVKNICPPGILCLNHNVIILLCVIITGFALFYAFFYKSHTEIPLDKQVEKLKEVRVIREPAQPTTNVIVERGDVSPYRVSLGSIFDRHDDRYTRAPKPLRDWISPGVDLDGSIYNVPRIATRGLPETYQSMGIVTTETGELLPLYGRRVASRSDRFNYYTRTDTNNPIPLPINHKRRDCQDDVGCDELFDGDMIHIVPTKQEGKVTIYRFNGPTYIPGLI